MANSVSKINVVVGANTSQLQAGMAQASGIVQRGLGSVTNVAQQATFAIDDFMTSFQTGGVAGGLRGAGNNLTMIAMSLGGIQTQLLAVAGISLAQLGLGQWARREQQALDDAAESARKLSQEVQAAQERISSLVGFQSELRGIERENTTGGLEERGRANSDAIRDLRTRAIEMQKLRDQLSPERNRLHFANNRTAADDMRLKALNEEISGIDKTLDSLRAEYDQRSRVVTAIQNQADAITAAEKARTRLRDSKFEFKPLFDKTAIQSDINTLDAELEALREKMRPSLSMNDVFKMLPNAHSFGSAGGISTINAATIGGQNARDAGAALQRQMAGDMKRIRELEEKKKGLLEVVGL